MKSSLRFLFLFAVLIAPFLTGCTAVKVVATPITVVRDVVDAPLVTLTNGTLFFAQQSSIAKAPSAGVGWSLSGPTFGVGYDISYFLFMGLTGIFGSVDYIVCRSLYPNFAAGISPWKRRDQSWGSLYFPCTRALWGDESVIYRPPSEEEEGPE